MLNIHNLDSYLSLLEQIQNNKEILTKKVLSFILGEKKRTKYELLDCEFPYLSKSLDNPRNEAYASVSVHSEAGINRSSLNIKN